MDILTVALAMFFFMVTYVLFDNYINKDGNSGFEEEEGTPYERLEGVSGEVNGELSAAYAGPDERHPAVKKSGAPLSSKTPGKGQTVKESVYYQDFYPWWRSTRWWNYDGWLYQKP